MTDREDRLSFPDGPRSELGRALSEPVDNAQKVLAPNGHIEQFIQVGMSDRIVARIGHIPGATRSPRRGSPSRGGSAAPAPQHRIDPAEQVRACSM